MKRTICWLTVSFVLLVALVLAVAAVGSHRDQEPVYSVSELQAHLAHDSAAWLHRPLRVRAVVSVRCVSTASTAGGPCWAYRDTLIDAQASGSSSYLLLGWAPPSPLLAALRRMPVLGRFVPALPPVRWGFPAVYGAELVALSPATRGVQGLYEVLLDAEP